MSENLIISAHKDTYYTASALLYKTLNNPDILFSEADSFHIDLLEAAKGPWKNIFVVGMRLKNDYADLLLQAVKAIKKDGKKLKIYIIADRFQIVGDAKTEILPYVKKAADGLKLVECINEDIKVSATDFERLNEIYKVLARAEMDKDISNIGGETGNLFVYIRYVIDSYWQWYVGEKGYFEDLIIKLADNTIKPEEMEYAKKTSSSGYSLTGSSKVMKELRERIKVVALYNNTPVMIYGDSGSGKEMVAGMIHERSGRTGEFSPVNCAGLTVELMESTLFGHKKGAFTGATENKMGIIEAADKGTVFLDEITEMPIEVQAKLLRFLEDFKFRSLGSLEVKKADVRILAATNKDIRKEIKDKRFREDLYYRLSGVEFNVPPLKSRKEDYNSIAKVILYRLFNRYNKRIHLTIEEYEILKSYDWPGNFRQMQKFLERVLIFDARGKDFKKLLSDMIGETLDNGCAEDMLPPGKAVSLEVAEKQAIIKALKETNDNKSKAAVILG
ncbi:MAG: sigma-54 dependent transcriptional regulator, partial [bacterium]